MGDRCRISISIHPDDYSIAKEVLEGKTSTSWPDTFLALKNSCPSSGGDFWQDELSVSGGKLLIEEYEVNYGWYSELEDLANRGCRFIAYNSAGSEYGPALAFGNGSECYNISTDAYLGEPVARINQYGSIPANQKDSIRKLMSEFTKLERLFKSLRIPKESPTDR